jgi:hypothetical protein
MPDESQRRDWDVARLSGSRENRWQLVPAMAANPRRPLDGNSLVFRTNLRRPTQKEESNWRA